MKEGPPHRALLAACGLHAPARALQVGVVDRQKVAVLSRGTMVDSEMVSSRPDASYVMAGARSGGEGWGWLAGRGGALQGPGASRGEGRPGPFGGCLMRHGLAPVPPQSRRHAPWWWWSGGHLL